MVHVFTTVSRMVCTCVKLTVQLGSSLGTKEELQEAGWLGLPSGVFSVSEPAAADKARSLMKLFLFKARSLLSQGWKPQRLRESPSDLWGLCPDYASKTSISEVSEGSYL